MRNVMGKVRMVVMAAVALAMVGCVNVQCAAGQHVNQQMDTDPLIGVAVVLVCGFLCMLGLAGLGSGGMGGR